MVPKVTLVLLTYNQEAFIEEATRSVLSQSYSPLEIIISDDASSDDTFARASAVVASYQGPHEIVLNKNTSNVGIGAHINLLFEKCSGELIIVAGGDDISHPERVSVLVARWIANGKPAAIGSAVTLIDELGAVFGRSNSNELITNQETRLKKEWMLERFLNSQPYWLIGCSAAWSKELWNDFGPMDDLVVYEDGVLSFRAILRGGALAIPDELVSYRVHDSSTSSLGQLSGLQSYSYHLQRARKLQSISQNYLASFKTNLSDLLIEKTRSSIAEREYEVIKNFIEYKISILLSRGKWWDMTFIDRFKNRKAAPGYNNIQRVVSLFGIRLFSVSSYSASRLRHLFRRT